MNVLQFTPYFVLAVMFVYVAVLTWAVIRERRREEREFDAEILGQVQAAMDGVEFELAEMAAGGSAR